MSKQEALILARLKAQPSREDPSTYYDSEGRTDPRASRAEWEKLTKESAALYGTDVQDGPQISTVASLYVDYMERAGEAKRLDADRQKREHEAGASEREAKREAKKRLTREAKAERDKAIADAKKPYEQREDEKRIKREDEREAKREAEAEADREIAEKKAFLKLRSTEGLLRFDPSGLRVGEAHAPFDGHDLIGIMVFDDPIDGTRRCRECVSQEKALQGEITRWEKKQAAADRRIEKKEAWAKKTHCRNGHELAVTGYTRGDDMRICRTCRLEQEAQTRKRKKAFIEEPLDAYKGEVLSIDLLNGDRNHPARPNPKALYSKETLMELAALNIPGISPDKRNRTR
jgi:hypothetical protein